MISETDITDWKDTYHEFTPNLEVKKLYDVKRDSLVSALFNPKQLINFSHIDGMYSFCKLFGTDDVVHLSACTDVYVWYKKELSPDERYKFFCSEAEVQEKEDICNYL
jgi:hypothetical protein